MIYKNILAVILLFSAFVAGNNAKIHAQCTDQVVHTSGTQTINCTNVTTTVFGRAGVLPFYCPATVPYFIGTDASGINGDGGYTFTFSPPVSAITLNFSGLSTMPGSGEEQVKLFINGAHYAVPSPGTWNGCDPLAMLTPAGDIAGCMGCSVSGWSGTNITGPISTLTILDTVISGIPNGALFSLFICTTPVGGGGVVDLGNDTTLCTGDVLPLDATVAGATSYLWQDGSTSATFTVNSPGTYWVQASTACGTVTDSIVVLYNTLPVVQLGNDTLLCTGNLLNLDVTTAGASYLWQDGSTGPAFTVNAAGTYWAQVTTACGVDRDSINVLYNPVPDVQLGNDTLLCTGDTLNLDVTTPTAVYLWQDGSVNPVYNINVAGTYWVHINVNGCTGADTILVNAGQTPTVSLGNDTNLCPGQTLLINATTPTATSYLWQDNSTNPLFNINAAGLYWVQVSNTCGDDTDSITISYTNPFTVELGNDTAICEGEVLLLNAITPGALYLWQDNSANPIFTVTQQGTYIVQVSVNNCTEKDTIQVNYNALPVADIGNDTSLCTGETLSLDASGPGILTYVWQDDSHLPVFEAGQQGTYWVQVKNDCGTHTDTIKIVYTECDCRMYIPNTFTPNGDIYNPVFSPFFNCHPVVYRLSIFNRWGQEIFTTSDLANKWDGMYKDQPAPLGVYTYRLRYQFEGEILVDDKIGQVNLLR